MLICSPLFSSTFSKSKKTLLKKIYYDHQYTFYCENPYEIKIVNGKEKALIIQDARYYSPRMTFTKSDKENIRTKRVEFEHIMPAYNFARHLSCWKEGGRKACKKDPIFNEMEADMHNLVPTNGQINADRSNFRYGADIPKVGQYGQCRFEVDFKAKRAYPREDIRGDIARVYFYMSDKYNINLSQSEIKMMEVWDKQDPIDEWERIKNKRVEKLQGNANRFIK